MLINFVNQTNVANHYTTPPRVAQTDADREQLHDSWVVAVAETSEKH